MTGEPKSPSRRRLSHPLSGADLTTLATVLARNGPVKPSRLPPVAFALLAAIGRTPFSLAERAYVALKRGATKTERPVFIVGHWRSGTTHLYNVMSRADHFGFVSPFATALPWDFLTLGRALKPLLARALPEHRYIDRIPVTADSPQEDEIGLANMTPLSYYHGLYFPEHLAENVDAGVFFDGCSAADIADWQRRLAYYYAKLTIEAGGRPLLIKNPVYTARIALLKTMWPEAKFIHIHRNPYKVFVSMRNFYAALLDQFALQDPAAADIDALILRTYTRMMDAFFRDAAQLPESDFIEIGFADFQDAPIDTLAKIYDTLHLEGFKDAEPAFRAYLESVKDYKTSRYALPDDVVQLVERHWGPYIAHWGYEPPR